MERSYETNNAFLDLPYMTAQQNHHTSSLGIKSLRLVSTGQAFNGEVATVVKSKGEKQKYEVEVKGPSDLGVCFIQKGFIRHEM